MSGLGKAATGDQAWTGGTEPAYPPLGQSRKLRLREAGEQCPPRGGRLWDVPGASPPASFSTKPPRGGAYDTWGPDHCFG